MDKYRFAKKMEQTSLEDAVFFQEEKLAFLLGESVKHVLYYKKIFSARGLKPENIKTIDDLVKLPILTKQDIRENEEELFPDNLDTIKYKISSTGGSTGVPLRFRLSVDDEILGTAIRYANYGFAGYSLGDRMAILAGSSLVPSKDMTAFRKIRDRMRQYMTNQKSFYSFDMSEDYMNNMLCSLNKFKPKFLRGYPSALFLFARHIKENRLQVKFRPKAVFTTAEVLQDQHRQLIESVFGCEVYDQYGLNDGGISAYECEKHQGLHIDMTRAILEIVDDQGRQVENGKQGKILATSLFNYAMPFIRYDTGDLGVMSDRKCACGRNSPLLEKIVGRTSDYLEFGNGSIVGTPVLTILFGKYDIIQYQVIQKGANDLLVNIIKGNTFSKDDEKSIKDTFQEHAGKIDITFNYVDYIEPAKSGKWKFIIREC